MRLGARSVRGASALNGRGKGGGGHNGRNGLGEDELLIGGTAWAFASDAMRGQLDVLFIDEAGQLPLAQLAGAARAAESLVLLGDQMQLPAPSEGHHPGESGHSCLEYLLRGAECVPPSMGVFLPTTFRMHPGLCSLVSDLSYRGMLKPHSSTAQRRIELAPDPVTAAAPQRDGVAPPAAGRHGSSPREEPCRLLTRGAGVSFVPVVHDGNSQTAPEEVSAIRRIVDELIGGGSFLVDGTGGEGKGGQGSAATVTRRRPLRAADVLVVAPYNLQVRALEAALPRGVRVGTVDRFQGQEAPVVVLSLCHSDWSVLL